jgi:tRNA-dihydrouridine synthase
MAEIQIGYLISEAAAILGYGDEHVRRLYRRGLLQGHREGKRIRLDPQSVVRYAGRHDRGQLELAVEWLAVVGDKTQVTRLATLLHRTFALDPETISEALAVWGADPQTIPAAVKKAADFRAKR